MDVVSKKATLTNLTDRWRQAGETVGFVPTMGALHEGHLSLVRTSTAENDHTVVSIFVNPTQFNDKEDLKRYPRPLEKDLALLEKTACDVVFIPEETEIYPEKDNRSFDFGYTETVMEGAMRPGHFNGVGQVVSKLFDIVRPHKAYFGKKDFQQIAIVKKLVNQLKMDIEIVSCPIIREADGLAMSSRNTLLDPDYRKEAPHIFNTLQQAVGLAASMDVESLKSWVIREINKNPYLRTEYFEIVDDTELYPVKNWKESPVNIGCIAVYAGKIRLIDNIQFTSPF